MSENDSETPVAIELDDNLDNKDSSSVKTSPTSSQNGEDPSKRKSEYF